MRDADLIALGTHGRTGLSRLLLGSVARNVLNHAPCSVLIARPAHAERFPGLIVHANDGSPESLDAAMVAGVASRLVRVNVTDLPTGSITGWEQKEYAALVPDAGVMTTPR